MIFIYILIHPLFWLGLFYFVYWRAKARGKYKLAPYFKWATLVWLFLIYVSPLPQWLVYRLEYRYPPLMEVSAMDSVHIVVLGGGSSIAPELPHHAQLSSTASSRLMESLRLYHQLPGAKLVFSGHSSSGRTSIAERMALAALDLQVSPADTLWISTPSNTREEAHDYFDRFRGNHMVVLVTSASHMPRAMRAFRKQGLQPLAAPTDYHIRIDPEEKTFHFKPSLEKIGMMRTAMKEYAGLGHARMTEAD
jgi:uncharacterized SAM-binding protein YcdF (DUF218 family)